MVAALSLRRLAQRGQERSWAGAIRVAAALVLVLGAVASAWIARGWEATVTRQREERLDRGATSRTTAIGNALRQYENVLQAERSVWLSSRSVTYEDFGNFVRTLDLPRRYPGLVGLGWRSFVPHGQAAGFVAAARRDGRPDFAIHPPGRRPTYYVTLYNEPAGRFRPTWGQDARAMPTVLAALEESRDSGRTTISNQTTLADDLALPAADRSVAFELFVPVYRDRASLLTTAERRAALLGWASGAFRAPDFLEAALQSAQPTTGVELYDPTAGGGPIATFPEGFRARGPHLRTDTLTFGGRSFLLRYAPLVGNPALTERTIPAPLVLATGIAVSALLGALLWLLAQVSSLYQRVGHMARIDALTGVHNRRVWDQELPRELARAARSGQPVCVALIDLDNFKAYNDRHGHQAGDRLLKAAAAVWRSSLRKSDLLVRYGGEEFALLLPDCGPDDAMEIAERLRTSQPEGTCSIGVAAWDTKETETELVRRADQALYAAKTGGRNRCHASLQGASGPAQQPVATGGRKPR
jgi:diguanylate cyclase (GGDEF)-like protein